MNCQELSEKMPAVARGELAWNDAESVHLAECGDCRAEMAIVRAGFTVANDMTIDAEAIAQRVLARLRAPSVARRFARPRWLVPLAAAAAVVLLLSRVGTPSAPPPSPAASPLSVHLPGLSDLDDADLGAVLESLEAAWTDVPTFDAPSLEDLDARELDLLRRPWES